MCPTLRSKLTYAAAPCRLYSSCTHALQDPSGGGIYIANGARAVLRRSSMLSNISFGRPTCPALRTCASQASPEASASLSDGLARCGPELPDSTKGSVAWHAIFGSFNVISKNVSSSRVALSAPEAEIRLVWFSAILIQPLLHGRCVAAEFI